MTQVQFRLLGPLEAAAGARVLSLGGTKQRALLAVLLLHPNEFVSRDRLIDELWGGRAPPGAAHNLDVYVSRLRKALRANGETETPLLTRPGGYLLRLESDQLDVAAFELLLARGQQALAGGDAAGAAAALEEALALWRGEPLADLALEPFAQMEVERLGELRLRALEARVEAELALGKHAGLISELEALVAREPLREGLRGQLMLALYRSGRQAEALAAYQDARQALVELGIEPGEELKELERRILAQEAALATPRGRRSRLDLPGGTVTLLCSDVQTSTRLMRELGVERYAEALAEHRRILRAAFAGHGGAEVDTQGDSFLAAFVRASDALAAASEAQAALDGGPLKVRIGVHTGEPLLTEEGYVGLDVHRAARICDAAHGGQTLLSQATRDLVDADVRDLGRHRLKDLSAAERLYQRGQGDFPPIRSVSQTNLPVPTTPFLGREFELAEVMELLDREESRLLTIIGPGGTGKTRLALQAAGKAVDGFLDGVWWIGLASLRESAIVPTAVVQTVGIREQAGEDASEALSRALGGKRALVVLDNAEHLLPSVADEIAAMYAGGLRLLVTSRERLQLQGEHVYNLPPLNREDAVSLFVARAAAVGSRVERSPVTAELCRRLDDLPLALELAAARMTLFSPEQVLRRLDQRLDLLKGARDAEPRQQTLRATISWSHDLLDEAEQRLFWGLSVFAGGCTLEAAEEVAEGDLDRMSSLIDKCLLRRDGERYVMLETIRVYARERLEQSGTAGRTMERLAEYLIKLGEKQEGTFRSTVDRGLSFARLEPELANFRAAINWALRAPAPMLTLRLAILPIEGRMFSWNPTELTRWLDQALSYAEDAPLRLRADVFRAAGVVSSSDVERSIGLLEESLSLYRQLGDHARVANALRWLAGRCMRLGPTERARAFLAESLEVAARADDARGTYKALCALGELERQAGNLEEAATFLEQGVTEARRAGDDQSVAVALHSLANLALERNEMAGAIRLYNQSLTLSHTLGLRLLTIHCLAGLASAMAASGVCESAGRLWGATEPAQDETGWSIAGPVYGLYEERVRACADRASTTFAAARELGRKMSLDEAVEYAFSALGGLATSAADAR